MSPDGKFAYTCNSLDDSMTVIDLAQMKATKRIDLGGSKIITKVRFGEQMFNDSKISFQRQFACHSCHPDGHVDGLDYDIEADGIGDQPRSTTGPCAGSTTPTRSSGKARTRVCPGNAAPGWPSFSPGFRPLRPRNWPLSTTTSARSPVRRTGIVRWVRR